VVYSTPVPLVEKPPNLFNMVDQFIQDHQFACFLALFISASLSAFLGIQFTDPKNARHNILSALGVGVLTTLCFIVPFFGLFLGMLCFFLAFPVYYQLPMETLSRTLPLSFALLIANGGILVALFGFIAHLLG